MYFWMFYHYSPPEPPPPPELLFQYQFPLSVTSLLAILFSFKSSHSSKRITTFAPELPPFATISSTLEYDAFCVVPDQESPDLYILQLKPSLVITDYLSLYLGLSATVPDDDRVSLKFTVISFSRQFDDNIIDNTLVITIEPEVLTEYLSLYLGLGIP